LTGLHNSGKDTIAKALQVVLNEQGGRSVSVLTGENIRQDCMHLIAFSYTAEERSKNLQRVAFVAAELARAGAAVVAAPVAAQQATRDAFKATVTQSAGAGGNFFVVHVATPLEHCEAHDRKGLYARARKGELTGVAGVDEVYETPERPDLTVDITTHSVPEIVHSIVLLLETNSLL